MKKLWDGWAGYSVVCPKTDNKLSIKGTQMSIETSVMIFQINKCSNDTKEGCSNDGLNTLDWKKQNCCKSTEEINAFVERLYVNTWSN